MRSKYDKDIYSHLQLSLSSKHVPNVVIFTQLHPQIADWDPLQLMLQLVLFLINPHPTTSQLVAPFSATVNLT